MYNVIIEPVLNGWTVRVGCKVVVFTDSKALCSELQNYLNDPNATVERYLSTSVNREHSKQDMPMPCAADASPQQFNEPTDPTMTGQISRAIETIARTARR